jgi:hypothetical protein
VTIPLVAPRTKPTQCNTAEERLHQREAKAASQQLELEKWRVVIEIKTNWITY